MVVGKVRIERESGQSELAVTRDRERVHRIWKQRSILHDANIARAELVVEQAAICRDRERNRCVCAAEEWLGRGTGGQLRVWNHSIRNRRRRRCKLRRCNGSWWHTASGCTCKPLPQLCWVGRDER